MYQILVPTEIPKENNILTDINSITSPNVEALGKIIYLVMNYKLEYSHKIKTSLKMKAERSYFSRKRLSNILVTVHSHPKLKN